MLAASLLPLAPQLPAKTRKGDKLFAQGRIADNQKAFDVALGYYEQALAEDPTDVAYQLAVKRTRFQAGQGHVDEGRRLREEGKLEEALAEFEKAYAIDPSSVVAAQELRRTVEMIRAAAQLPAEQRGLTPGEVAKKRLEEKIEATQPVPELKPISPAPINLKMNNQPPRVLFETVGKLAGINVVFDPEYQTQQTIKNLDLELTNSTLEQALDYLGVITKSFWKALSPNAIFVTLDNPTKRRDFEEHVVKVFYLENVTSVQELQEIATATRTITDIKKLFTYTSQNAIIVRGEADKVALAEKVIYDLDKPKSEVLVDVLFMEVARGRTRELGATLVSGGTPGLNIPIVFTPQGGTTSGGDGGDTTAGDKVASKLITLADLGHLSSADWSITLPNAVVKAILDDRGARLLQAPQVRSLDGQKASLRVGDKIPYATGSFQPGIGVGGVGVSPLVSTQFQFAEVGVNVDVTPKIHGPEEISLHVELEVSAVREYINIGGLQQPVITQRKVLHDIRIREGEVNIIGGLTQSQDTKSVTGLPFLADLPGIGKFFSVERIEHNENELLIVLVPHVMRTPDISALNLKGVASGAELAVRLNYAPKGGNGAAAGPAAVAPQPGATVVAPTPVTAPGTKPAPASPAEQPAPAETPAPTGATQPAPPGPPPAGETPAPAAPPAYIGVPALPPGTAGPAVTPSPQAAAGAAPQQPPVPAPIVAALTQPGAAQAQATPPQPVAEEMQAAAPERASAAPAAAAAKQQPKATAPSEAPPPPQAEPAQAGPQVLLTPASVKVGANALVGLQLEVKNVKDLFAAPVRIKYDPEILEFKDAVQGDLLNRDGKQVIFARQAPRDTVGVAQIQLNRVPGAGGIDGSGTLLTLTFQARKGGTSQVAVESLTLRDTKLQPILTASPIATIVVE